MRLMQIGRNCLADFLMVDPAQMIALAELVRAVSDEMSDEHWGGSYGGFWEVAPVAYLAGYTEPAALVRAFKRWTGETPAKFRERSRSAM